MRRETVWERKMLILLRCMDALMQDYRDVYGEKDAGSESLVEEFKEWMRNGCRG